MTKFISILILLTLSLGCKKEKLEDEKIILIGTWEWIYTDYNYSYCNPPSMSEVLTPSTENRNYSLEFLEKGNIIFNKEDKKRIVFHHFEATGDIQPKKKYKFGILLNNKSDLQISGWIGADTLILSGSYINEPFEDASCNGCCSYINYFVRQ